MTKLKEHFEGHAFHNSMNAAAWYNEAQRIDSELTTMTADRDRLQGLIDTIGLEDGINQSHVDAARAEADQMVADANVTVALEPQPWDTYTATPSTVAELIETANAVSKRIGEITEHANGLQDIINGHADDRDMANATGRHAILDQIAAEIVEAGGTADGMPSVDQILEDRASSSTGANYRALIEGWLDTLPAGSSFEEFTFSDAWGGGAITVNADNYREVLENYNQRVNTAQVALADAAFVPVTVGNVTYNSVQELRDELDFQISEREELVDAAAQYLGADNVPSDVWSLVGAVHQDGIQDGLDAAVMLGDITQTIRDLYNSGEVTLNWLNQIATEEAFHQAISADITLNQRGIVHNAENYELMAGGVAAHSVGGLSSYVAHSFTNTDTGAQATVIFGSMADENGNVMEDVVVYSLDEELIGTPASEFSNSPGATTTWAAYNVNAGGATSDYVSFTNPAGDLKVLINNGYMDGEVYEFLGTTTSKLEAYVEGYKSGYSDGYVDGYKDGYADGKADRPAKH